MKFKRSAALLLTASMAVSLLAGCGSSGSSDTASAETSEAAESTTEAAAAEETAAEVSEDDKYGGSITLCYNQEPTTCFLAFSTSTADRYGVAPAMESLGRQTADGDTYGWLAESITADIDTLTATIVLNQGIKFSDGTDFNAEAVVWNFDKMVEGGKASELATPVSYEATDEYTVTVTYDAWANNIVTLLGQVFIYSPTAFETNGEDWAAINPVGTGAYTLTEYIQGDHMTYTKRDDYWRDGEPYLDEIKLVFLSDTTSQVSAFLNNEINALVTRDATVRNQIASVAVDISNGNADTANIGYVMFCSGQEDSPFYDIKVRQAVMHAIEWDAWASSLTGGYGEAVTQFGVPSAWNYDDTVPFYEYDLEEAKSLLAEAGYPDGFETTITTIESNNDIAVLLQAACAEIGITAEIKVLTEADFNAQKSEGVYDYGMITGRGSSKLDFTSNYIRLYSSKGVNYLNMMAHPEDYEEALFGAQAAETIEEKKELLKTASKKLVYEHALIMPVYAVYTSDYTHGEVEDLGLLQTVDVQWTPEAAYLVD